MKITLFITFSLCLSSFVHGQHKPDLHKLYAAQNQFFYQGQYAESLICFDSILQVESQPDLTCLNTAFIACETLLMAEVQPSSVPDLNKMLNLISQKIRTSNEHQTVKKNTTAMTTKSETEEVFTIVHEAPTFRGGLNKFHRYVFRNIECPDAVKELKLEGEVKVQFIVTKEGKVKNVELVDGLHAAYDAEVIRVVSQSPDWNPGIYDDQPVNVIVLMSFHIKPKNNFWEMIQTTPSYQTYPQHEPFRPSLPTSSPYH